MNFRWVQDFFILFMYDEGGKSGCFRCEEIGILLILANFRMIQQDRTESPFRTALVPINPGETARLFSFTSLDHFPPRVYGVFRCSAS